MEPHKKCVAIIACACIFVVSLGIPSAEAQAFSFVSPVTQYASAVAGGASYLLGDVWCLTKGFFGFSCDVSPDAFVPEPQAVPPILNTVVVTQTQAPPVVEEMSREETYKDVVVAEPTTRHTLPTYITNNYYTTPTIIREIVRESSEKGSLLNSKYVTYDFFQKQIEHTEDSQNESRQDSFVALEDSFTTDLLTVTGLATLEDSLAVTDSVSAGSLSVGSLFEANPLTGIVFIDGNVGIGSTSPNYELDVNGTINASSILVNGSPVGVGSGSVSSVALSAPTGFTVSGSPIITSGTLTLTYAAGYEGFLSSASSTLFAFYSTPSTRITDGTGLTWSSNTLNCDTATGSTPGCLSSTDWTTFMGKVASSSIDSSAELAALVTDETGIGPLVFSGSPVFTGGAQFAGISASASSTLGYASSTALTVSGSTYLTNLLATASSTIGGGTGATGLTINGGATTTRTAAFGENMMIAGAVSIGSVSAAAKLDVQGTGNASTTYGLGVRNSLGTYSLVVRDDGNVGIGTTTPYTALTVAGTIAANSLGLVGGFYDRTASVGTNGMVLQTTGSGVQWVATSTLGLGGGSSFTNSSQLASLLSDETGSGFAVFSGNPLFGGFRSSASSTIGDGTGTGGLTVSGNSTTTGNAYFAGNVGIGTASPGVQLDIRGLSTEPLYGATLLSNGDFSTGDFTSWTAGAGWSISSNSALHTAGNTASLDQTISVISGTTYQIEWTDTGASAGTYTFSIGGVSSRAYNYWDSNPARRTTIVASGTGSQTFSLTPSTDYNGSIDNVTVRTISTYPSIMARFQHTDGTSALEIRSGGTGLNNTFIGLNAGSRNTTGYQNSAVGMYALRDNTTGSYNSAQGVYALRDNTTGSYNSAQGVNALRDNTTGSYNSAQGVNTLISNTIGISNSAQGMDALFTNTSGNSNSAQGGRSLYNNTTGSYNSAQGVDALSLNTIGSYNTAQGMRAGRYLINGSSPNQTSNNSLYLGYDTRAFADGDTNEIVIGASAMGVGSNSAVFGNDAITRTILKGNVGIGTTSPYAKLTVHARLGETNSQLFTIASSTASGTSTLFTVLNNGYVGIGTASPTNALMVNGSISAVETVFSSNGNGYFNYVGVGNNSTSGNTYFTLRSNNTEQVRIDGNGNVGIGTTSPSAKLTIHARAGETNPQLFTIASSTASGTSTLLTVLNNGNVGIGTSTPTAKLTILGTIRLVSASNTNLYNDLYTDNNGFTSLGQNITFSGTLGGSQGHFNLINVLGPIVGTSSGYFFSNQTNAAAGTQDTGLYRLFPGVLGIGNGTVGNSTGTLIVGTLGIGTTSPSAKLTIHARAGETNPQLFTIASSTASGTSTLFTVLNNGNVGIGNSSPSQKLVITGSDATVLIEGSGTTGLALGTTGNSGRNFGFVNDGNHIYIKNVSSDSGTFIVRSSTNSNIFSVDFAAPADSMIVSANGNVGVGTSSPEARLVVGGAGTPSFVVEANSGSNWFDVGVMGPGIVRFNGAGGQTEVADSGDLGARFNIGSLSAASNILALSGVSGQTGDLFRVDTNGTGGNQFVIKSNGNVGIGTTTPSAQLTTTGTVRFSNFGAGTLQTDAQGNLSVSSDERLKNIEGEFTRGIDALRMITPITYEWNESSGLDTKTLYAGFSAQNIQEAIPEAVGIDSKGFLTLSDRPILAALVNATKEQQLTLDSILAASSSLTTLSEGETFWTRLSVLLDGFVDGVLTLAGIDVEEVKTETLCIGETCVDEDTLKALLLNASANQNEAEGSTPVTENNVGTEEVEMSEEIIGNEEVPPVVENGPEETNANEQTQAPDEIVNVLQESSVE